MRQDRWTDQEMDSANALSRLHWNTNKYLAAYRWDRADGQTKRWTAPTH